MIMQKVSFARSKQNEQENQAGALQLDQGSENVTVDELGLRDDHKRDRGRGAWHSSHGSSPGQNSIKCPETVTWWGSRK